MGASSSLLSFAIGSELMASFNELWTFFAQVDSSNDSYENCPQTVMLKIKIYIEPNILNITIYKC